MKKGLFITDFNFLWVIAISKNVRRIATVLAIDQICFSDFNVFFRVLFELSKQTFYVSDAYLISHHPLKKRELLIRFKLAISQFCGRLMIQYALFKTISGFCGKGHDPN